MLREPKKNVALENHQYSALQPIASIYRIHATGADLSLHFFFLWCSLGVISLASATHTTKDGSIHFACYALRVLLRFRIVRVGLDGLGSVNDLMLYSHGYLFRIRIIRVRVVGTLAITSTLNRSTAGTHFDGSLGSILRTRCISRCHHVHYIQNPIHHTVKSVKTLLYHVKCVMERLKISIEPFHDRVNAPNAFGHGKDEAGKLKEHSVYAYIGVDAHISAIDATVPAGACPA